MPVFVYLCFDFYFLFLNLLVALLLCLSVVASFRDQFLFLLCFPYFSLVGNNSFLVTKFETFLSLYLLLFTASFLLIAPFLAIFFILYLVLPIFESLTLFFLGFSALVYLVLFSGVVLLVFNFFLPVSLTLLGIFNVKYYHLFNFIFDFTVDSWITAVLFFISIALVSTFFYLLLICILFVLPHSTVFFVRLVFFLLFFIFVVLFAPYDYSLHIGCFSFYFLLTEVPVLVRFLVASYAGRVA